MRRSRVDESSPPTSRLTWWASSRRRTSRPDSASPSWLISRLTGCPGARVLRRSSSAVSLALRSSAANCSSRTRVSSSSATRSRRLSSFSEVSRTASWLRRAGSAAGAAAGAGRGGGGRGCGGRGSNRSRGRGGARWRPGQPGGWGSRQRGGAAASAARPGQLGQERVDIIRLGLGRAFNRRPARSSPHITGSPTLASDEAPALAAPCTRSSRRCRRRATEPKPVRPASPLRVWISRRNTVPAFGPPVPCSNWIQPRFSRSRRSWATVRKVSSRLRSLAS